VNAICLIVAGLVEATLSSDEVTLGWQHSVAKTRWEEHYRIDGSRLAIVEARIQGMGAGMEPPASARLRDGWWTWRPVVAPLAELRLTQSPYTRDYDLCWIGKCAMLSELIPSNPAGVVVMRACEQPDAAAARP
jgi:hypothetical protein